MISETEREGYLVIVPHVTSIDPAAEEALSRVLAVHVYH